MRADNGECVDETAPCKHSMVKQNKACVCPTGSEWNTKECCWSALGNACLTETCASGMVKHSTLGTCICPVGSEMVGSVCTLIPCVKPKIRDTTNVC